MLICSAVVAVPICQTLEHKEIFAKVAERFGQPTSQSLGSTSGVAPDVQSQFQAALLSLVGKPAKEVAVVDLAAKLAEKGLDKLVP